MTLLPQLYSQRARGVYSYRLHESSAHHVLFLSQVSSTRRINIEMYYKSTYIHVSNWTWTVTHVLLSLLSFGIITENKQICSVILIEPCNYWVHARSSIFIFPIYVVLSKKETWLWEMGAMGGCTMIHPGISNWFWKFFSKKLLFVFTINKIIVLKHKEGKKSLPVSGWWNLLFCKFNRYALKRKVAGSGNC